MKRVCVFSRPKLIMRRLLNSFAQELQGGFAPQQSGGDGYGGAGGGGIGGLINNLVQQVQPSNIPCPRRVTQAGFPDWVGIADSRYQYFNVCPSCYASHIRPTMYAGAFVTTPPAPPHLVLSCDMSRYWVRMAGMVLLTMNQDRRHDITLLPRVAGINVHDGPCPNANLNSEHIPTPRVSRVWYTIRDPSTGVIPLPGWIICSHCVVNIQTLCPTIGNAFAPTSQAPTEGSCALVPSDAFDDQYTAQQLQNLAACVATSGTVGRTDMSALVNWLRDNPPLVRGTAPSGLGGHLAGRPYHVPAGLCPQNYPSNTLKCYSMRDLSDCTVCEKCYAEVIKPDLNNGVDIARLFDGMASTISSGFTCQLYSERMRRVWAQASSTGDLEFLRQKASRTPVPVGKR